MAQSANGKLLFIFEIYLPNIENYYLLLANTNITFSARYADDDTGGAMKTKKKFFFSIFKSNFAMKTVTTATVANSRRTTKLRTSNKTLCLLPFRIRYSNQMRERARAITKRTDIYKSFICTQNVCAVYVWPQRNADFN